MSNLMKVGYVEAADVFIFKEIERPTLDKNTVIIKNHAVGVNFADALHVKGKSPIKSTFGIASGECAGEVVAVGENVKNYKVGDKVIALTGNALAEYTSFDADDRRASKIPENIDYKTACAIGVQALTAYSLVQVAFKVQKGEYYLVHAAAGGVGSLLVQFIDYLGGIPIASTSSKEKVEFLKELGVKHIINYKEQDILQQVLEITNGKGVHAAYDSVGKATFDTSLESLGRLGTVVVYGSASGKVPPFDVFRMMVKNTKVQASALWNNFPTKTEADIAFDYVYQLYLNNGYKIKITTYAFENSLQAFEDILTGNTLGKLVIEI